MGLVGKISWEELDKIRYSSKVVLIDIRSKNKYQEGHIEPAVHIDYELLELKTAAAINDYLIKNNFRLFDKTIVVYCESGGRSVYFARHLQTCGYNAMSLSGGYGAYKKYVTQKFKYI